MKNQGNDIDQSFQNMDNAGKALKSRDIEGAWEYYHKICVELLSVESSDESNALFIKACLNLSQLGFVLGGNFLEVTLYLTKALEKADQIGDRRSRALIHLHLGRLYYFLRRRMEASEYFKKGTEEVEELGDEDIMTRSAEFIGLYYFTQGLLKKASHYFEIGLENFETTRNDGLTNVLTPMWAGYTAAYMGEFSRAIGTIDYYRRFCIERKDYSSAATLRSVLGIILLTAKKKQEAYHHLTLAKQEAEACNNHLALYFCGGGFSYYLYISGRLEEAYALSETVINRAAEIGIQYQYSSPMFLEMFHGYYRAGKIKLPGVDFIEELARITRMTCNI